VTSFDFTPDAAGEHLLQVRYFGWAGFPGSAWGPGFVVSAADPGATPGDRDGDGMPDAYEDANGLDADTDDHAGDLDIDGLTNLQEFERGTRANRADTDGDGRKDGAEVAAGTNPLLNEGGLLNSVNELLLDKTKKK
jgi:hypothetical protein